MIAALLLAASAPSVIEAERAFAAAAQTKGQWTAFRETASPDAVMFVPEPVNAPTWLKDKKDPPQAVKWQPTAAWMSCDGTIAVTTGNWQGPKAVGFFTTIWKHQPDGGWKWVLDSGDVLPVQRKDVANPMLRRPVCRGTKPLQPKPATFSPASGSGASVDGTLAWAWTVQPTGARTLNISLWGKGRQTPVASDQIAAPQ